MRFSIARLAYIGNSRLMSTKQQLQKVVDELQKEVDAMPEGVPIAEAFERLYQAFKLKQLSETGVEDSWELTPPLPSDPASLAEIRAGIEQGIAEANAGQGEDWEVVHSRLRRELNLPNRQ
jgi:hypothetical protein